jgi:hypothetical protein
MPGQKRSYLFFITLLLIALACNLPSGASQPQTNPSAPQAIASTLPAPTKSQELISVLHQLMPGDVSLNGDINYDVESQTTSALHRAPYGDVYPFNRLERPFTQNDMTYLPDIDIVRFRISSDDNWYYIFIELIGNDPNDPLGIDYGAEIDQNKDGFGDVLIWVRPPYAAGWTTNGVTVNTDTNRDSAGVSAQQSDAPFSGDGYDTLVFDQGKGQDPDLAWARLDPRNSNVVEVAFKKSLAGKVFMWSAWADALVKDPSRFSYNDRYTIADAGSPQKDNSYYPIKALFAMDSTCRAAFGFKPTGYEPLICPPIEAPPATKSPRTPPQTCHPDPACVGPYFQWNSSTCHCDQISIP